MRCPACGRTLTELTVEDLTVDVCRGGCGGVWFDNQELKKVDEAHEGKGEALLDIERDPNAHVDHSKRRGCPRCDNIVMMRHFFSVKREVEVDTCPGCNGVWLDAGELGRIRTEFETAGERQAAAAQQFGHQFMGDMSAMRLKSAKMARRAAALTRATRFVGYGVRRW